MVIGFKIVNQKFTTDCGESNASVIGSSNALQTTTSPECGGALHPVASEPADAQTCDVGAERHTRIVVADILAARTEEVASGRVWLLSQKCN